MTSKYNLGTFSDYKSIIVCKLIYRFISNIILIGFDISYIILLISHNRSFINGCRISRNIILFHEPYTSIITITVSFEIDFYTMHLVMWWDLLKKCLEAFILAKHHWLESCMNLQSNLFHHYKWNVCPVLPRIKRLRQGSSMTLYLFIVVI